MAKEVAELTIKANVKGEKKEFEELNKTIKKLQRSKVHKSVNNIINLTGNMSEEYITEKSGDSWPINAPLLKELKILLYQIFNHY